MKNWSWDASQIPELPWEPFPVNEFLVPQETDCATMKLIYQYVPYTLLPISWQYNSIRYFIRLLRNLQCSEICSY